MNIYGLVSTENNNKIRYVGKTKFNIEKRLKEHINGALKYNKKTYKDNWIRKVYKDGFEVKIKLIEECNSDEWKEKECFWIKELTELTNITCGGDSGHGLIEIIDYELAKRYLSLFFPHINSSIIFKIH